MKQESLKVIIWVMVLVAVQLCILPTAKAAEPCPLPSDINAILDLLWPMFDTNADGGLSASELSAIYTIPAQYFSMVDTNHDGKVDRQEFQPLLSLIQIYLPNGVLSLVDANGNQLIEFQEVANYVSAEQFQMLDRNGNGVIDCGDLGAAPIEGETQEGEQEEGENSVEGENTPTETDPCEWVDLAISGFSELDQDGNGVITRDELNFPIIMIYPPIVDFDALFQAFDLDENGSVTMSELEAWKDMCANSNENDECPLPIDARSILNVLYPYIDFDGNGIITKDEVLLIYPAVEEDVLSQYHLTLDQVIMILDRNHDSGISIDELISMIELSGYDLDNVLGIIDHNGDSMISYEEVSDYVSDDIFAYLDVNGNGLIDCNDLNTITIPPIDWEGEIDIDPCWIAPIVLQYFDSLDQNDDGKITLDEVTGPVIMIYPLPIDPAVIPDLFAKFDLDSDGAVTKEEIQTVIDSCPQTPIEGEPLPIEGEIDIDPCWIAPIVLQYFDLIDQNSDGKITLDEITGPISTVYSLPINSSTIIIDLFNMFDSDADGAITKEEVTLINQNCPQVPIGEGEIPSPEGEIGNLPDLWNPCSLAQYALDMFGNIDQNGDNIITTDEIIMLISSRLGVSSAEKPWLVKIISMLDLDNNGGITIEEIQAIVDKCAGQEQGNGEPGNNNEGENLPNSLILERGLSGNHRYLPGQTLTLILMIRNSGNLTVSALGLRETLPTGWILQSVVESSGAVTTPDEGSAGTLEFAWMDIPSFPVKIVYTVLVPNDADGPATFSGQVLYRTTGSEELTSPICETVLLKGWTSDRAHSADSNRDWTISLSEMLRVIQIFNFGGYGCDESSEDGYGPGADKPKICTPHSADYRIQDWKIDLSELLRMIQLYNAPGKAYILQEGTEDGFAPLIN